MLLNIVTPKNHKFSIWDEWNIKSFRVLGVEKLKHFRVAIKSVLSKSAIIHCDLFSIELNIHLSHSMSSTVRSLLERS